jgi:SAM-dependent methyltransferase
MFPNLGWAVLRRWFSLVSSTDTGDHLLFMNYGYADLDADINTNPLTLRPEDQQNRYLIQLYHHLAKTIDWSECRVLEVGCGRGGGAAFICRYHQPKQYIGLDLTQEAIDFCNQFHAAIDGLTFMQGDAEDLQFAENEFDVVINVESTICYPNPAQFFQEVARVLKPGGRFLYTDFRPASATQDWREQLEQAGLEIIEENDITPNVVLSLDLDNERKKRLIDQYIPALFRRVFSNFAGMKGTRKYEIFASGQSVYLSFICRKPK